MLLIFIYKDGLNKKKTGSMKKDIRYLSMFYVYRGVHDYLNVHVTKYAVAEGQNQRRVRIS